MKCNKIHVLFIAGFVFYNTAFMIEIAHGQAKVDTTFENYYLGTKSYPKLWSPALHEIGNSGLFTVGEIQGVTHDSANWYFTWTTNDEGHLWKVPVGVDLENFDLLRENATIVSKKNYLALDTLGYWHWGDPDYYVYNNVEYIVVPMYSDQEGITPAVAIFRASNLKLIFYGKLKLGAEIWQKSIGWCAIHPITGDLYTSNDFDYYAAQGKEVVGGFHTTCDNQEFQYNYCRSLYCYSMPWKLISPSEDSKEITLVLKDSNEFRGANKETIELYNMQGGEFW